MAKAEALTLDALTTSQIIPRSATPARGTATSVAPVPLEPKDQVPLQLKIPRKEARAIKIAAAERDMTIRDFMLTCFHDYMGRQ